MAKECPKEILDKFAEHGCESKFLTFTQIFNSWKLTFIKVEAEWVKGEYAIFIGNYPSGKATKAQVMDRLKKASTERFPNAVPENVADALYPAFDPDNKGEVDFIAAAKGLAVLFSARIEIRAQLFFSLTDENGDGKIQPDEMKKFLVFINETQVLGNDLLSGPNLDCNLVKTLLNELFRIQGR